MPKLVTTLALWIAVIFSIGFNIAHYPIVWEMMAASVQTPAVRPTTTTAQANAPSDAPTPQEKTSAGASTEQAATSDAKAVADSTGSSKVAGAGTKEGTCRVQCDGNTCKLVPVKGPDTSTDPVAQEAAPAARYGSAQPAKGSDGAAREDRTLVSPAGNGASQAAPAAAAQALGTPSLGSKVRRLPALTEESVSPAVAAENAAIRPIPLYATTGSQSQP